MTLYVVGNPLVRADATPIHLADELRRNFPHVLVLEADPNENFLPEEGSIIIDTVLGIDSPRWFFDVESFEKTKSVTPHDYDLGLHLCLLLELHKISSVTILGIPAKNRPEEIIRFLKRHFSQSK